MWAILTSKIKEEPTVLSIYIYRDDYSDKKKACAFTLGLSPFSCPEYTRNDYGIKLSEEKVWFIG